MIDSNPVGDASSTEGRLSRRALMTGACAVGCLAVAGCSDAGSDNATQQTSAPVQVPAGDVPVGGGVVLRAERVVVTQPEPGVFHAFSAVCTHQGCVVAGVTRDRIVCRCHGSQFAIADGAVLAGPATEPLPPRTVTATGDTLTIGA